MLWVILRRGRSVLDVLRVLLHLLRIALAGLLQVVTASKLRGRLGTARRATPYTLPLHTPHSTPYTRHFTLRTSHFTFYTPHVTLQTLHCTALAPRSTRLTPHFRLQTLHSTLYIPHSTLHTPHLTLHCTLHTLQATLCTLHSTLYTPHCAFYTPAAFNNFTPYTFHSKPHASHSASAVTSEECIRLLKQYASPKVFASQKVSAAQTVFASQKNVLCDCLHSGSLVGLVLFLCL